MTELKPCPFCGAEAEMYSDESKYLGKCWYVRCKKCYSRGVGVYYESRRALKPNEEYEATIETWEKAIEAWNRRVNDD